MNWLSNLVRRARLRGVSDGRVQTARAESLENQAHDRAERHQDYGFAGHPVDGQGLVMYVDGNTLVLRLDRILERPELAPYEVAVWHREGHMIKLKAGRVTEVTCDRLLFNVLDDIVVNTKRFEVHASERVLLDTPTVEGSGDMHAAGTVIGEEDVASGPITLRTHKTAGVKRGDEVSDGPTA